MKFIVTKELGRLARWLRVLGCDAKYFEEDLKKLFITAFSEGRTIVTKDSKVPESRTVKIIRIKNNDLKAQLLEFKAATGFSFKEDYIFTRCVECNTPVTCISKSSVKGSVPPYVFKTQKSFSRCPKCKRLFWKATHFQRLKEFLYGL